MLKTRQIIPPLAARTPAGQTIRAGDYKQKKNLVIVFLHGGCERCGVFLNKLRAQAAEFAEREAVALVVFPGAPPLGMQSFPVQLVIAVDMTGRSQRAYMGEDSFSPAGR